MNFDDQDRYSVAEARRRLGGIGKNTIQALINSGELKSYKRGGRRWITADALRNFVEAEFEAAQAS